MQSFDRLRPRGVKCRGSWERIDGVGSVPTVSGVNTEALKAKG